MWKHRAKRGNLWNIYPDNRIQGVFQGSKWEFEGYIYHGNPSIAHKKPLFRAQVQLQSPIFESQISPRPLHFYAIACYSVLCQVYQSDDCVLGHLMYQLRFRSFKEVYSNQIYAIAILEYFVRCHRLKREFYYTIFSIYLL